MHVENSLALRSDSLGGLLSFLRDGMRAESILALRSKTALGVGCPSRNALHCSQRQPGWLAVSQEQSCIAFKDSFG